MGSNSNHLISLILYAILMLKCIQGHNSSFLDSSIYGYALKKMGSSGRSRSGILYEIPLPANFSGITASFVRVTSERIWSKGVDFSNNVYVYIPPKTLAMPFSRRVDILYENLGNLSSSFYNVTNYTFIAPVIGFLAYDAAAKNGSRIRTDYGMNMIQLHSMEDPMVVSFPNVSFPAADSNVTLQCVRFKSNGEVEFANVTGANSCATRINGHFSIVIPAAQSSSKTRKERRMWKWWEIGFVAGVSGFVFSVGIGLLLYKWLKLRRFKKLEKESERSEALDSIWVGKSRMPSATSIRTQPIIENTYVP